MIAWRRCTSGRSRSRGVISLMAVLFLLTVIAAVLATTLAMTSSDVLDSSAQSRSVEALLLAESGVERAVSRFAGAVACVSLGETVNHGGGSITVAVAPLQVDYSGVALPAGQCRVTVTGQIATAGGNAVRTVDTILGVGGGSSFNFPDAVSMADWATFGPVSPQAYDTNTCPASGSVVAGTNLANHVLANSGTYVQWDSVEPAADPGSFLVHTADGIAGGSAGGRVAGYREHAFASAFSAGTVIATALSYQKGLNNPGPDKLFMALDLVATDGTVYRLWCDSSLSNIAWTAVPTFNFTVPAGKTIDRARLVFDLVNRTGGGNKRRQDVWFDQIQFSGGGGAAGVLAWREPVN